jgi:hypothetical protein
MSTVHVQHREDPLLVPVSWVVVVVVVVQPVAAMAGTQFQVDLTINPNTS